MVKGVPMEEADAIYQMASIMFDEDEDSSMRLKAAVGIAKYTYQELKSVEDDSDVRPDKGLVIQWAQPQLSSPSPGDIPELEVIDKVVDELKGE